MSKTYNIPKKCILKNPVEQFKKLHPDANTEQLGELSKLHHLYTEIDTQQAEIQITCKKISREIGKAKRDDFNTDQLIQAMQKHTAEVRKQQLKLDEMAESILNYFKVRDNSDVINNNPASKEQERVHSDQLNNGNTVSICLLDDDYDAWNRYVESNPAASIYHRAEWKDLIQNTFGHKCYYFYAHNNDEIVGILPLVRLKSRLFGDYMVSMPYFNYGGALASSLSIENKLIQAANSQAEQLCIDHIEYRDSIARDHLAARTEKVNMILSLPGTDNDLWKTFTSKLRSQIKRSSRENTEVIIGNNECLDDFYTVFARNMRDLGTPVYAKSFFSNILNGFSKHSIIIIIRMNNRPVAAGFLIGYNDTLEIPWASTIKDVNHLSINMQLYWEVLKFAISKQYSYFDFGRSSKDSSTFRFKQQWGAKPQQLYMHYWLNNEKETPSLNPSNAKYKILISIWKRLPIALTKLIGPPIVKNLP